MIYSNDETAAKLNAERAAADKIRRAQWEKDLAAQFAADKRAAAEWAARLTALEAERNA